MEKIQGELMRTRTKEKILVGLVLFLVWISAGTLGLLPAFSNTYVGQSHSIFAPMAVLLDIVIYILITHSLVTAIFWIYDRIAR